MKDAIFRHKNHYVPELLLKRFSATPEGVYLWEYRLVVEDERVPEWELRPASLLARTSDLYTVAESADESDRVERWLDEEFESPAREPVLAAVNGQRLSKKQWRKLVRLYAAQFLRTPAYYVRHKDRWAADLERHLLEARKRILPQLPKYKDIDADVLVIDGDEGFPLRYTIRREEGLRRSIHLQSVTGRKYWMWAIQQGLRATGPMADLEEEDWSILSAPTGFNWFLSDNPAVCIRRRPDGTQSLDGGWRAHNSKLMLPLSPTHLLYCQVGSKVQERYSMVHPLVAKQLRSDLADAALRSFYSHAKDHSLANYRKRVTNRERFQVEANEWKMFGQEHSRAERFE